MWFVRKALLLIACFVIFASSARAVPITWKLEAYAPALSPPGVGGTFTYDVDTNTMLSWNIHQCQLQDCGTLEPVFPAVNPFCPSCQSGFYFEHFDASEYQYTFYSTDGTHMTVTSHVTIALRSPLTNAAGVILLIPGGSKGHGSRYVNGFMPQVYDFTSGSVQAVPEPGFALCSAAALILGLAGKSRRR